MTITVEEQKRRLAIMLGLVGVSMAAAVGLALAAFAFGQAWALPAFIAAVLLGFGAQFWFIFAIARKDRR